MKTLLIVMVIVFTTCTKTNGQLGGATVIGAIKVMEASLNNVLNNANYVANNTVNNAALNGLNLITTFRQNYSDILDKTVASLSQAQYNAFTTLEKSINGIVANISKTIEELNAAVGNAVIGVGAILGRKNPYILKMNRLFFCDCQTKGPVELTFNGYFLNESSKKTNTLKINGKVYEPSQRDDKTLTFLVDAQDLATTKEENYLKKLEVIIYTKKIFRYKSKKYSFLVRVLPCDLGTISFEYETEVSKRAENIITRDNLQARDHCDICPSGCSNPTRKSYIITPSSGYVFDVRSIEKNCEIVAVGGSKVGCDSHCTNLDFDNITPAGINLTVSAGVSSGVGRNCHYKCTVRVKEYRDYVENQRQNENGIKHACDKAYLKVLPGNTTKMSYLKFTLFNGKEYVFTDGRQKQDIFVYQYDPNTKTITFKTEF